MKDELWRRVLNILIAIDQLAWTIITLGHGSPDETISAAAWRLELKGHWFGVYGRPFIDLLFFFDKNHCQVSYESEILRTQLPMHYSDARSLVRRTLAQSSSTP